MVLSDGRLLNLAQVVSVTIIDPQSRCGDEYAVVRHAYVGPNSLRFTVNRADYDVLHRLLI